MSVETHLEMGGLVGGEGDNETERRWPEAEFLDVGRNWGTKVY
jgi:hypothetical protein